MNSLTALLELNKRTLQTQQAALQTSQQNVSNANTPGFHRQRAVITSTPGMLDFTAGQNGVFGTGTQISQITRIRDSFVESKILVTKQKLGELTEEQNGLEIIETVFNELSEELSLSNSLTEFWNSWETLAQDPTNLSYRADLRGKAVSLTEDFNTLYTELEQLQSDFEDNIELKLKELNSLTEQVAELNRDILKVEANNVEANNLRDQQELLIGQISELADVKVVNMKNGSIGLFIDGSPVVQDFDAYEIDDATSIKSGEIGGVLNLKDNIIPDYLGRLDQLADAIVDEVNSLHTDGNGLDGSTNIYFFDDDGRTADTINVSDDIMQDLNKIAAAKTNASGDNSNAQEIAALREKQVLSEGTFEEFYNSSIVTDLGNRVKSIDRSVESTQAVLDQLVNRQESVSGVSLDEELINMVQFQRVFEAAARITTTVDSMLDTVVNSMGLVGR